MAIVGEHLGVMPMTRKLEFSEKCAKNIFQDPDNEEEVVQWEKPWGIVLVTMGSKETLIRNIEFSMIQEMMGLGPSKYCLMSNGVRDFERRVLLVLNYLPRKKICLYPPTTIPRGPFEEPRWRSLGKEISERRVALNDFDAPGMWEVNTSQNMVCIRFLDNPRFIDNTRFAFLKESLRVGPERYCLVYEQNPLYLSQIAIVMTFLPRHKMFMYPGGTRLGGMFLQEPWLSRGLDICSRTSITTEEFQTYFPSEA